MRLLLNKPLIKLLNSILIILMLTSLAAAQNLPRLEIVDVMNGYPIGSRLDAGFVIHPPEGIGVAAPAEAGGPGPALNLRINNAPHIKLEDIAVLGKAVDGVYHDFMPIRARLAVESGADMGEQTLELALDYALPGQELRTFSFNWQVIILPPGEKPQRSVSLENQQLLQMDIPQITAADHADLATADSGQETGSLLEGRSLAVILILVFLGGIALNLTPCVYPIIPITISYFVTQANSRRARLFGALAYWMGMVIMYTFLGVFASLSGGILGQALTSSWVIMFLVVVFLALAASMLGFWEIKMPGKLNQLAATNRSGISGALLMGLTVGILAAPCLGPFVLGLMTHVASSGSIAYGALLFFVFSLGLGLPLTILAFFSSAINNLPGAGAWMVWVRKFFAVVLIVMAIYIAQPLLPTNVFVLLLVITGVAGGIYLAMEKSGGGKFVMIKRVVGIVVVLAAVAYGCQYYPWQNQDTIITGAKPAAIDWQQFNAQDLQAARGKPVLLDFTASWCQPCRQLEAQTFPDPEVRKLLSQFACFKVDVTNGPPNAEAKNLISRYQVRGVPTLMFLNSNGEVLPYYTIVGFVEPEILAMHLREVLKADRK